MIQLLLVIALFLGAGAWIAIRLYKSFSGKSQPGCEKCAANTISKAHK